MGFVIFEAHSGWRYVVILVAVLAILKYLIGWLGRGRWSNLDRWLGLLTPVTLDIQFLLGLILWITQARWTGADVLRSWEHPVTMIITVALAHMTWNRVKRAGADADKYRSGAIGFLITGIVLALGIARITSTL
ncbi:MAG TPA: hypothetical protein VNK95_08490 [Caldilineaceae bacterium]|nr:hypothetical protein [Caldilineaceae bacterium]